MLVGQVNRILLKVPYSNISIKMYNTKYEIQSLRNYIKYF